MANINLQKLIQNRIAIPKMEKLLLKIINYTMTMLTNTEHGKHNDGWSEVNIICRQNFKKLLYKLANICYNYAKAKE